MYEVIYVDVSSEDTILVNSLLAESDITCHNHCICSGCCLLHHGYLSMQVRYMKFCQLVNASS